LLKTILEGRVEGKSTRGRQGHIWENNIKRGTGNSLTECTNGTRDRQRWRYIVTNLRCGDCTKVRCIRQVLKWTPQGQRGSGRPRGTWKRTYEAERKGANGMGLEIKRMPQDRIKWRQFVSALCTSGPDED
jgi:hypothetical protein